MNDKDIRQMLMKESESINIELSSRILDTPIDTTFKQKAKVVSIWNRFRIAATATCSACIILICALFLGLNDNIAYSNLTSYVLEINPSVCITTDINNEVLSVCSFNSDGDELLSNNKFNNIKGSSLETCIATIISIAFKMGYFENYSIDKNINLYVTNNKQDFASRKADFAIELIKQNLILQGLKNIEINDSYLSIENFKERMGIDKQYKNLDEMKDDIISHDKYFNPNFKSPYPTFYF